MSNSIDIYFAQKNVFQTLTYVPVVRLLPIFLLSVFHISFTFLIPLCGRLGRCGVMRFNMWAGRCFLCFLS